MTEHTRQDITEAIEHKLKTDFNLEDTDGVAVNVEQTHEEGNSDYIHAHVNFETATNIYRNSTPSYIQNYRFESSLYDIQVVSDLEELELEG